MSESKRETRHAVSIIPTSVCYAQNDQGEIEIRIVLSLSVVSSGPSDQKTLPRRRLIANHLRNSIDTN